MAYDFAGNGWTGSAPGPPFTPPAPQPVQPATQEAHLSQAEATLAMPPPPDAERRQLTILFCDLVDSTRLASQLDPEDLRDVVRAYQTACAEVIQWFDGHIAQYLGDGLLVYFGYPQAHDDDASRAVSAGLGILSAMGDLNTRLKRDKGMTLALRLGIHTGLVVVGAMGGGARQEQLALGETPNIAARIQGLAAPNTVVISDATQRLIQGYFACQPFGEQTLRGMAEPVALSRVLSVSGAQNRVDIMRARGLTPLVGRESEVTLLRERWEHVKAGHGHVVLLSGEGGIGKSRLVHMLKEHVAHEPHGCWECRSSPYHENTALFPVTDCFQRALQWQPAESAAEKLGKLERMLSPYRLPVQESVPLLAPFLSLPLPAHQYPPLNLSPQRQRQKTLETLVAIVQEQAEHHPMLFIVEDLHWTDPSTLEFLTLVIDHTPTASLLTVLTCRPTFQPSWSPRSYLTELTVTRLSQPQIEQMTAHVAGGTPLPGQVLAHIVDKTDGVPLCVEELTKALLESGYLKDTDGHDALLGSLSTCAIPATLHDALLARLDRLGTAKAVAQYAAVIGREFSYAILQAVAPWDAAMLQQELGRLVAAEIVYQRGVPPQATYVFKHALIRDTAYQSLLKSTRQQYHQRIAQGLVAQFPEMAATQPELVAQHYTEAGLRVQAIGYWQRAGQQASERSAHREAIAHLTQGLEVLATLPDTPERTQHELDFQITLGPALMVTKSCTDPEVERIYTRARTLCQQMGESPQLFPALWGLWRFYAGRGELQTARELGEQLLALAEREHDPLLLVQACHALGPTLFWLGELAPAQARLAQGIAHYTPQQHRASLRYGGHDPGSCCRTYAAWTLWARGYPDQALHQQQEALQLAQELAHPFTLICALKWGAWLHQFRREGQAAQAQFETAMPLSSAHASGEWLAYEQILRGWALAAQGQGEAGIAQMREGLAALGAMGEELYRPYQLLQLAEVSGTVGQAEAGLRVLAEVRAAVPPRAGIFGG